MAKTKKVVFEGHHRFEWSPVLIGTAVALAITIVLMQFGAAIGFSGNVDVEAKNLSHWSVIAVGFWVLLVQLVSSLTGGYVAGYTRSVSPELSDHVNEMRNGFYGLGVWAVSTVAVFIGVSVMSALTALGAATSETVDAANQMSDLQENAVIIGAFALGATSFMSAAVAWFAAVYAGHHRLHDVDFGDKYKIMK